ncbi:MAG: hypothetical protein HYT72_01400 [Candidatus Aenigmarchaeota archaeon]|nr:hypothetical protein [Candidatus Aenigmarchaeota archaeon]
MPVEHVSFEHPMRIGIRDTTLRVRMAIEYNVSGNTVTKCIGHYAADVYPEDLSYVQIFRGELAPIIERKVNQKIDDFFAARGFVYLH